MTSKDEFRKGGYEPLMRLPGGSGDLDAVLFARGRHLLVCITAIVEGRREIVGLEVQPLPSGFRVSDWAMGGDGPQAVLERAQQTLDRFREFSPAEFEPVSAALLRGVPLLAVLGYRASAVERQVRIKEALAERRGEVAEHGELSREDEAKMTYLDDALLYVEAVREGARPAVAIAEERGISARTAEGRVAKARALGLLTPAVGKTASGELTADAKRLRDWRGRATTKEDVDG
ncbi:MULTISPECIES: hypothetical protein [unclassified Nocardioides]|uniref:hypothetical protein n=1 Tax=unclassified Nocardioides TaxID=2615069 RepID=UPI003014FC90